MMNQMIHRIVGIKIKEPRHLEKTGRWCKSIELSVCLNQDQDIQTITINLFANCLEDLGFYYE